MVESPDRRRCHKPRTIGEAHLLNLSPGAPQRGGVEWIQYLSQHQRRSRCRLGVPLKIAPQVSGVTESVQVSAESLVVDPGRQTITTSVTYDQLQKLPSSRDPWVVLQTSPASSSIE
jgi:hypothetical protein